MTVGNDDPVQLVDLGENTIGLTIAVPENYRITARGVRTFHVVRTHDGKGDVLVSSKETNIPFGSSLFSTFALGVSDEQFTITFDTDGGSKIDPITQDYDTEVTAPEAPTKEGYTFVEWQRDGKAEKIPARMPAEDRIYKAVWKINQYTITFDTDGGSKIDPITQDYGSAVKAPANPTRSGYTFTGWSPKIPSTMPAQNLTVKAQWKKNDNGKSVNTGDDSNLPLWITLLGVLIAGMIGFNVYRRKRR